MSLGKWSIFSRKLSILNKSKYSSIRELVVISNNTNNPKENWISYMVSKTPCTSAVVQALVLSKPKHQLIYDLHNPVSLISLFIVFFRLTMLRSSTYRIQFNLELTIQESALFPTLRQLTSVSKAPFLSFVWFSGLFTSISISRCYFRNGVTFNKI